jgi:hypothetical protein
MMDGDDAGIAASKMISAAIETMFNVSIFKLWEFEGSPYIEFKDEESPSKAAKAAGVSLWDPASCPDSVLDAVKQKYFTRS